MDSDLLRRLELARDRLAAEPLALTAAAEAACLSSFHFHRQFVRLFAQTPHAFATERRLERAKALLLSTDLPIGEVCFEVGYASVGSFTSRFAREFGMPPQEFRRGVRRLWRLGGIRSHRFVPLCFVRNGKIGEVSALGEAIA